MKNIYCILSILLGYMITLASCQSEGLSGTDTFEENVVPIEFAGIQVEVATKTATLPDDFTGFKVWASRTVSDAAQPNYNVFGTTGTDVEKSGSGTTLSWIYTPVRYWQTGTYNFHAIWPTSIASTPIAGTLGVSGLTLTIGNGGWDLSANQIDLMSATTQVTNTTGTPGQVVLTFNHMLSKSASRQEMLQLEIQISLSQVLKCSVTRRRRLAILLHGYLIAPLLKTLHI